MVMLHRIFSTLALSLVSHSITVFYARTFVWKDLYPPVACRNFLSHYYNKNGSEQVLKTILIYLTLRYGSCSCPRLLPEVVFSPAALLMVIMAIPQLYRRPSFRRWRVLLGPLTPLLAIQQTVRASSSLLLFPSILLVLVSLTAFVVVRPDNDQVIELLLECWDDHVGGLLVSFVRRTDDDDDDDKKQSLSSHWLRTTLVAPTRRRQLHGRLAACNTLLAVYILVLSSSSSSSSSSSNAPHQQELLFLSRTSTHSSSSSSSTITTMPEPRPPGSLLAAADDGGVLVSAGTAAPLLSLIHI